MIESRSRPRFLLESPQPVFITREFTGQHLDRNLPIEPIILRTIHLAHSAFAERTEDPVCTKLCAGLKSHQS